MAATAGTLAGHRDDGVIEDPVDRGIGPGRVRRGEETTKMGGDPPCRQRPVAGGLGGCVLSDTFCLENALRGLFIEAHEPATRGLPVGPRFPGDVRNPDAFHGPPDNGSSSTVRAAAVLERESC